MADNSGFNSWQTQMKTCGDAVSHSFGNNKLANTLFIVGKNEEVSLLEFILINIVGDFCSFLYSGNSLAGF